MKLKAKTTTAAKGYPQSHSRALDCIYRDILLERFLTFSLPKLLLLVLCFHDHASYEDFYRKTFRLGMAKISVKTKSGKEILSVGNYSNVKEIYTTLAGINKKWNSDRIRLTTEDKKIVLSSSDSLKDFKDGDVLIFKDLGYVC